MLKDAEEHLQFATEERSFYRHAIETSKEVLKEAFTVDGQLQVPPVVACIPPASKDIEIHFSLDMAQQVRCMQLNSINKLACIYKSPGALSE